MLAAVRLHYFDTPPDDERRHADNTVGHSRVIERHFQHLLMLPLLIDYCQPLSLPCRRC